MSDEQVCETVQKFGANMEECARLNASLSCLRSAHKSGETPQQANAECSNVCLKDALPHLYHVLMAGASSGNGTTP